MWAKILGDSVVGLFCIHGNLIYKYDVYIFEIDGMEIYINMLHINIGSNNK